MNVLSLALTLILAIQFGCSNEEGNSQKQVKSPETEELDGLSSASEATPQEQETPEAPAPEEEPTPVEEQEEEKEEQKPRQDEEPRDTDTPNVVDDFQVTLNCNAGFDLSWSDSQSNNDVSTNAPCSDIKVECETLDILGTAYDLISFKSSNSTQSNGISKDRCPLLKKKVEDAIAAELQ
ncbi:hypothetical protein [Pseudobacteriovorax antillogorgiicola]|uniref:Uncharacterized protein n=1 Tax=Pseudobacteriovorax antillogorgiicola TaxID=1513793 RepID=A0A1Y6BSL8_9BACT|nr:hypothetical protein [Pseudobacteriovorax antillogorgiicola]TCS54494.1 hypothetical protein EDD56_1067 [Pseudobacteriovorax antillogorgiicola]SMF19063.1 hypothetical protein SAMN06296036_106236 [Pseudobacteriovorax antillogorgiicola]